MTIFNNNLKRILKSKIRLLILLVAPVIFIVTFTPTESAVPIRVAIIDKDQTPFTVMLYDALETNFRISDVEEDSIVEALIDNRIDYALVIDKGFTDGIIEGDEPKIKSYTIEGINRSMAVENFLDDLLSSARNIALASGYNEGGFYKGLDIFLNGSFGIELETTADADRVRPYTPMGFLVQFMLYMCVITAGLIPEDRINKTFNRIFAAPITIRRYMFENILSFLTIAISQVIIIFAILKLGMNIYFGNFFWDMLILFIIFSVVCVVFGVMITSYLKTPIQAYITIFLITTPLAMLGGCYWPRDFMPDVLISISNFLPTTWVMEGAKKLMYGGSIMDIGFEIAILSAFAGVFFLAGTLRKADIVK